MELQTISQVSKDYGISVRMLRYYEQIGLIKSIRKDDNGYRFYDEAAIKQLHSIILLRKLRVSTKQINDILNNQNASLAVKIFEQNINELDDEITSLSTIKSILARFAKELREKVDVTLQFDLLNNKTALSIIDSLSFSKNHINHVKENVTMENLNKAHETLSKLKDSDVRIVYLPPMTVAVAHSLVDEGKSDDMPDNMIEKFVRESRLLKIKPDARGMVASNCSKEDLKVEDVEIPSYDAWVSIPDDMEVKAPLTKKTFEGGLYAAHSRSYIKTSFKDLWRFLAEWVNASKKYEIADERPFFEEILNYYNYLPNYEEVEKTGNRALWEDIQMDLLLPIKKIIE